MLRVVALDDVDRTNRRWLDADELATWMSYVVTTTLLESALDRQLQRDADMPFAYYLLLAMLSDAPDRTLRMSDLAASTRSSQSRLSHAVSRLESRGWIARRPCPHDRRSTLARLTDAGLDALSAAAPGHVDAVRTHLFDKLTCAQVGQLRAILAAVLVDLDGPGALPPPRRPDRPATEDLAN